MPTPDNGASWQLTLTIAVALGGFVVNAGIAAFNAQRTGAVKRLDHFNNVVRRPAELLLEKINACCDDAEDYCSDPAKPPASLDQISRNFHNARRSLERTLQDAQTSDLIPGSDWVSHTDNECDNAADALNNAQAAVRAGDAAKTDAELKKFRENLLRLRRRVQLKIDTQSTKAMAFRFGWW